MTNGGAKRHGGQNPKPPKETKPRRTKRFGQRKPTNGKRRAD